MTFPIGTEELACSCGPGPHEFRIWGSGPYTGDSPICTAAVHSGVVGPQGGEVTVMRAPLPERWIGSTANGLSSLDWNGPFGTAYDFVEAEAVGAAGPDPSTQQAGQAPSEEELIASAESAAPPAVSEAAAIYDMGADGSMVTLREGTNGWWCMPDSPATPGPDPMCGDANSMEWAMAWIGQEEPPAGKPGFMYMLVEGSDASNTDPYATGPAEGNNWIETGPHVMIVNAPEMMAGYPDDPVPDTSVPYVMWAGTPYAHLMIPVE